MLSPDHCASASGIARGADANAVHKTTARLRNGAPGENGGQRVREIVLRRRGPLEAELDVAVIDSSSILHGAPDDQDGFGGNGGAYALDQCVLGIA